MCNILAFLAALVLTVLGVGYYLGWYTVKSTMGASGHRSVNIDVNTTKIDQDVRKGSAKIEQALEKQGGQQPQKPSEPVNLILPNHQENPIFGTHPVHHQEPTPVLPELPLGGPMPAAPPVLPGMPSSPRSCRRTPPPPPRCCPRSRRSCPGSERLPSGKDEG